ncbi:peptidylprolyl isomerase [Zooshikella ganghwensis]|uniref:peptidylprolyl isomerase n=1 Tax=Zooshikella ganghwensis TaxID=202772 RepID=UPI003B8A8280
MMIKMKLPGLYLLIAASLVFSSASWATTSHVRVETSIGNIELELYPEKAPITVKNFLRYIEQKFYNGTIFHRVIPGFMAQGGGFNTDMERKPTHTPIKNEAQNGLKNERGTIAMARLPAPDTATSQFFINVSNNAFLNHGARGAGYAVFGRVTQGMEVIDKIVNVPTHNINGMQNVPVKPIVIKQVTLVNTENKGTKKQ